MGIGNEAPGVFNRRSDRELFLDLHRDSHKCATSAGYQDYGQAFSCVKQNNNIERLFETRRFECWELVKID